MNLSEYEQQFQHILDGNHQNPPYDEAAYLNYVKLNQARIRRWNKRGKLLPSLENSIKNIEQKQQWLLITEPWCGDAANSQAFIGKLASLNPNIELTIQNRDAEGSEIDQYLTNGGKSIPKLVVRDQSGKDLFSWGPRPQEAQNIALQLKEDPTISLEEKSVLLQNWYNQDQGASLQQELEALFQLN